MQPFASFQRTCLFPIHGSAENYIKQAFDVGEESEMIATTHYNFQLFVADFTGKK